MDFKSFIPKPRMPQVLSKGALTTLSKADVVSLIGVGWQIKPPNVKGEETTLEEVVRLSIEIRLASERMNTLIEKGE